MQITWSAEGQQLWVPSADGLVERFNRTLITVLSKTSGKRPREWDRHLQYVLFAYRISLQDSTNESPFYLLYGRDAHQPTSTVLSQMSSLNTVDVDDYKHDLVMEAWQLAKKKIQEAQTRQKNNYDKSSSPTKLQVGDRVMVYMPQEKRGKTWKLSRPYHGPYRILSLTQTNAEVWLVDCPDEESIFVSLNRVYPCHSELPEVSWTGGRVKR